MQQFKITRRSFLKAAAATGLAAAVSSEVGFLKDVAKAAPADAPQGVNVLKSSCRMCHGTCCTLVHVKDGRVIKVEGNPDSPTSLGGLCSKGLSSIQNLYSPYRIKYPMKRVGARGEDKWQRITWDEALETIASKITEASNKFGPEAVTVCEGTGRNNMFARIAMENYFGWRNVSCHYLCHQARTSIPMVTMGGWVIRHWRGHPKVILSWGDQTATTMSDANEVGLFLDQLHRGAKLISVDPRFSPTVAKADLWLPIRPGTDGALALGWLNIIIGEELYDKSFVSKWTDGPLLVRLDTGKHLTEQDVTGVAAKDAKFMVWDEKSGTAQTAGTANVQAALSGAYTVAGIKCKPVFQLLRERVAEWTPEKTAQVTWVPKEKIVEAIRLYATTKPAAYEWGVSFDMNISSVPLIQAALTLCAITGNLDQPGGNVIAAGYGGSLFQPNPAIYHTAKLTPKKDTMTAGFAKHPLVAIRGSGHYQYWLDEQVAGDQAQCKVMIIAGNNPIMGLEDPQYALKALNRVPFIVDMDILMTPTAQLLADIVLPASTWLERNELHFWGHGWIFPVRQKAVEMWEARDDKLFYFQLAQKLGEEKGFPWKTEEEYWDWILKPSGKTFRDVAETGWILPDEFFQKYEKGMLRADKQPGFSTKTGRYEMYASWFQDRGFEALPYYVENPETPVSAPDVYQKYPLIITTGHRSPFFFHTGERNVPLLRDRQPWPEITMYTKDAAKLSIADGDWVWVESPRGKCRMKAHVTEGILPGVVAAQHDWWYPETGWPDYKWKETNINLLVDRTPLGKEIGSTAMRGFLCKVYKAEGAPEGIVDGPWTW